MDWTKRPWASEVLAKDPKETDYYVVGTLTAVTPYEYEGKRLELRIDSCLMCSTDDPGIPLVIGEEVYAFGQGRGYAIRGIAVGDILTRYLTEAEAEAQMKAERAAEIAKRLKRWEDNLPTYMADLANLQEPFQARIKFFMRNPQWGPEHGGYEMFVCKEAVKIAAHCKTAEAVQVLYNAPWEEQIKVISDGHSGNTMGAAFTLAHWFLIDASLVPKIHGALCPLVGCEEYGCFAATDEAKA